MLSRIKESKVYQWVSTKAQLLAAKMEALDESLAQPTPEIGIYAPLLIFPLASSAVNFNFAHHGLLGDSLTKYSIKGIKYIADSLPEPEKLYSGFQNSLFVFQGIIAPAALVFDPQSDALMRVCMTACVILTSRAMFFPTEKEKLYFEEDQRKFAVKFNNYKHYLNVLDRKYTADNIVTHNYFSNVFNSLFANSNPRITIPAESYSSDFTIALQQIISSKQSIPRPPATHLDITRLLVINNQKISERSVNEIAKLFLTPKEEVKYLTDARDVNIQSDYEEVNNSDDEYEIVTIPRLQKF